MAKKVDTGDMVPDFTLKTVGGGEVSRDGLRGQSAVIYFYPKDDTPGCTKEAIAFTALQSEFDAIGTKIVGVSADSPQKHEKFKAKHNLTIDLASDEDHQALEAFGVWVEKNMYGRKYMGIERSTFLIDDKGVIAAVWRKVKVPGHAESVLAAARELASA